MKKFLTHWLRRAYRLLIKNKLIRYTWLLALLLFSTYQCSEYGLFKRPNTFEKAFLPTLNAAENVTAFSIQKNSHELQFTHTERGWFVVENAISIPVADSSVQPFLQLFASLKVVRYQNSDSACENQATVNLTLINGKTIAFWIKNYHTPDGLTAIQRCDEQQILLTKQNLQPLLSLSINRFRNAIICTIKTKELTQLKIQKSDSSFYYQREKNRWQYQDIEHWLVYDDSLNQCLKIVEDWRSTQFYDRDRDFLQKKYEQHRLTFYTAHDSTQLTHFYQNNHHILASSANPTAFFELDSIQLAHLTPLFSARAFLYAKPKPKKKPIVVPKEIPLTE